MRKRDREVPMPLSGYHSAFSALFAVLLWLTIARCCESSPLGTSRLKPDRQSRRAVDVQRFARLPRFGAGQLDISDALQEIRQRDLGFEPRQGRAQTEVNAVAERD